MPAKAIFSLAGIIISGLLFLFCLISQLSASFNHKMMQIIGIFFVNLLPKY